MFSAEASDFLSVGHVDGGDFDSGDGEASPAPTQTTALVSSQVSMVGGDEVFVSGFGCFACGDGRRN